jgi:NAD-dependent SIR2 family protein deacetylase
MMDAIQRARDAIAAADSLLITAGAGIGVDSGLPDFRGPEGFWRAYPAFEHLRLRFEEIADPRWFEEDPHLAWGFYGQRLDLYRRAAPHRGFATLLKWASQKRNFFVFTSNVDGHFQRAGFPPDRIVECHGSIHHVQCVSPCCDHIWPNDNVVGIEMTSMKARDPLPRCPRCGDLARPNVLMFGDSRWVERRTDDQLGRYQTWRNDIADTRVVVIECGAGTAIPTVRMQSEDVVFQTDGTLIRINPREPRVPPGQISLAMPSLAAISAIEGVA